MVHLEQGDPANLRNSVLIYSDFQDFGKIPTQIEDIFRDRFKNKTLALFASLCREEFVSGIEMLTRDDRTSSFAQDLENYSEGKLPPGPKVKPVMGLMLPFRKMYKSTVEGDLIYAGKTPDLGQSLQAINLSLISFIAGHIEQNGDDVLSTPEHLQKIEFMQGISDIPEERRARYMMQHYVQPMMYSMESGNEGEVLTWARSLENFCYNSCLTHEAKKVYELASTGQTSELQTHLEMMLAIADQRYLDAAKLRDSLENN